MPTSLDPLPGENEIECARCGAVFFYELTRCPNCGVNLYEPDDGDEREKGPFKPHPAGLSAKIGNFFQRLAGKPHPAEELFNQSLQQATLRNDLLHKVGGDRAAVERLIDFERQNLPKANRTIWLQNAIRRWERDNQ
jgi:predicted  nucleic acid-binding Zn-ribbon protein